MQRRDVEKVGPGAITDRVSSRPCAVTRVTAAREQVRLAELVAAMSLATDLGLGQPMEHVMRSCLVGLRLAELLDLEEPERAVVYYVALLAWVGCHADSHEQAAWFGDDIEFRAGMHETDLAGLPAAKYVIGRVGRGRPPLRRALLAGTLLSRRDFIASFDMSHCRVAGQLAMRLGLGDPVRAALQDVFERWDGKGQPRSLKGDRIALAARIVELADIAEAFRRLGGLESALEVARRRRATQFDPELVDLLTREASVVFAGLDEDTTWARVIASEPALGPPLSQARIDVALEAIADFADLKSPYMTGHSRGVTELASKAAASLGLGDAEVAEVRRAALMHDMGRLGIPNTIWDKPASLSEAEMERMRLHPYLMQRMFSRLPGLAGAGQLAGQASERLDGSGYPRGLTGAGLTPAARALQAADVYQALTEPRAYRSALGEAAAAHELRGEVAAGRLDAHAVEAVLGATGQRVRRRREGPDGLTPREVEVLLLLARGASNKEIAKRLVVSPKTVGSHVEHIYSKIGCSTRVAASLYAMQHGLLPAQPAH
jgi:HD-GYP domain-containing protein (c-di-GMP phosphodiesterase class II)